MFGPKKPPPLVPACLIATSAATGPRQIVLGLELGRGAVERSWPERPRRRSSARPMPTSRTATTSGDRDEHEDEAPHQVDIEVAQVVVAAQAAEGRQHDGQAGRRGDEHQPDDRARAG